METMMAEAMTQAGLRIDRRHPRGAVPRGEAENVHRGGGRYISIIGNNDLFHNTGRSRAGRGRSGRHRTFRRRVCDGRDEACELILPRREPDDMLAAARAARRHIALIHSEIRLAKASVNFWSGFADQTASTPPVRSARRAARKPARP